MATNTNTDIGTAGTAGTTPDRTTGRAPSPDRAVDDRTPIDVVAGAAAIIGPILLLGSTVAWVADADAARAVLLLWSMIGIGIMAAGVAHRVAPQVPLGAAALLGLGVTGACAGAAYAAEAAIVEHFGIERLNEQSTATAALVLQVPGLLLPVSLIVLALVAGRAGLLPRALSAVLIVGAVGFPASRIPEVAGVAVVADGLLCVALVTLGLALLAQRR